MCRSDSVTSFAVPGTSFPSKGPGAAMLVWKDDWCRNLILASILTALIFVMLGFIYLASTRPTIPSTPETKTAPSSGTAFVQVTADPLSLSASGMIDQAAVV